VTPDPNNKMSRVAVDIGSTVVKVALLGEGDHLISQEFCPRDFEAGIANQVKALLVSIGVALDNPDVLVCSSANGGLQIGIVCLTKRFSGTVFRDQVLLAGANPTFICDLDDTSEHLSYVDILLIGGGIDSVDADPLAERLRRFAPDKYRFGTLLYAGNKYLAHSFCKLFPKTVVVSNPLGEHLSNATTSVFEVIRRAYLDDLVYKQGISELRGNLANGIRPTPEIVNLGFQRAVQRRSSIPIIAPCVLLDIGGATTDLHYTVEIVHENSEIRPTAASSFARYVFTDLGIVASRDTLLLQLRSHPRLHEFLTTMLTKGVREAYQLLREGEYEPSRELLSYACLFLALDRFAHGRGPDLPTGDLPKIAQIILTGGAAQGMSEELVERMIALLLPGKCVKPIILVDRCYQIWVDGIVCSRHLSV